MAEVYARFSHFNFASEAWREAAARYLELEAEILKLEHEDSDVVHDEIYEDFGRCGICERINELTKDETAFASRFAVVWAKELRSLLGGKL